MDAQGVGATITYLRRYALAALACIAQEDDDGEVPVGRKPAGAMICEEDKKKLSLLQSDSDERAQAFAQCMEKLGLTGGIYDIHKLTQEQADKIIVYVSKK